MGRKKIAIQKIVSERNRQVTYKKRRRGVAKKLYELSVLCDCEIALVVLTSDKKLYEFASSDMDEVLKNYCKFKGDLEYETNDNYMEQPSGEKIENGVLSNGDGSPTMDRTQGQEESPPAPLPLQSSSVRDTSPVPGSGFTRIETTIPANRRNIGGGSKIGKREIKPNPGKMTKPTKRVSQHLGKNKPSVNAAGLRTPTGNSSQDGGVGAGALKANSTDKDESCDAGGNSGCAAQAASIQAQQAWYHWATTLAGNVFYHLTSAGSGGGEANNAGFSDDSSTFSAQNPNSGSQLLQPTQHQHTQVSAMYPPFENNSSPQAGQLSSRNIINNRFYKKRCGSTGGKNNIK